MRKTPRAPRVRQYEAFISYSHAADEALARELQRSLNRIARPSYKWWQWWPPRVFRDQTNLIVTPDLGAAIERALLASDAFVLLASPRAAASPWVGREAETWRAKKPVDRLFIALTEGGLAWDDARGDFDPVRSTALPPSLGGAFDAEPLWVDFTGVREDRPFARDPGFLDGAATLAAAIRRTDKDALVGEDVRQRRRARQLVVGAIATLTLLAVAATVAAVYAFVQRNHANERARIALSRQYAAQSIAALDVDPEQSLGLAARAATTAPTDEAENALRRALRTSRLRSIIDAGAQVFDAEQAPKRPLVAAALATGNVRIWNTQTGRPVLTLRLGDGAVRSVSFSADGNRVLGAGKAGAAVWSTSPAAQQPLATFDESGSPLAAAFSPDGELVATGDLDGVVRLWRAETGVPAGRLRPPGERSPVTAVAFSSDGARLVAASGTRTAVWSLRTTTPPLVQSHERIVFAVAFSPDGLRVATGDLVGVARVWNLRTGRAVELNGHETAITSLAFSPDGRSVVTASQDETGRIWDAATGRSLAELRGHDGLVLSAAFAPDGRTVLTGGQDGAIRIWAFATTDSVQAQLLAPNELTVRDVAFHPDGRLLVTASEDRTVRVWDSRSRRVLHVLHHGERADDWVESARFGLGGRRVVSAGDDGTARVWDPSSGALLATLGRAGGPPLYDAALSPDGELVVAAGGGPLVRVWRWRQQTLVQQLRTSAERVDGVAFSPDGTLLAVAAGRAVRVWRVGSATASPVLTDRDKHNELTSVAFDPSGTLVAAGSSSGAASVWDIQTKSLVARVTGHGDTVADVAFSGDGRYLVTAGHDGIAKIWTVPGGGPVTSVRTRTSSLEGVAFAPRGRRVAVAGADGRVTVFECAECRPLQALICLAASSVTPRVLAREHDAFRGCD